MSRTPKKIAWLFLNPVNSYVVMPEIELTDLDWTTMSAAKFIEGVLSPEMREWFDFEPLLSSLRLWIPRDPILRTQVTPEWIKSNIDDFDPTTVVDRCTNISLNINQVFGSLNKPLKELPVDILHLIVTAERKEQRRGRERKETRDTVADLGRVMYNNYRTITVPTSSLEFPSPSTAAGHKRYAELQTKPETTIYDGSYHFKHPVDTTALPITIYHPVFQSFAENITTAKPDKELLANVCKWMKTSTAVGSRKEPLTADLRDVLSKILMKPLEQFIVDGTIPDGVARAARSDITIPVLVMEYKPALGEGGCDPLTQASHTVWKFWRRVNLQKIRDRTCCPTFIIAGCGPYLAILGAIITDKFVVQHLTSLEWLGIDRVFEDKRVYRIAQVFDSLRRSLQQLDDFYKNLDMEKDMPAQTLRLGPRFFPRYTTYTDHASNTTVEFEYLRPLTPSNKSPFLVKIKDSGEIAVVKFVARYGTDAHHALAEAGMAPRLRFCGSLDGRDDVRGAPTESAKDVFGLHLGPLRMVVMDYVGGTHLETLEEDQRPKDLHKKVKAIVNHLHGLYFVFGDLRPPNVMVSGGKVLLVDFDWAGKCGEVHYPDGLGEGITDYCKGKDFGVIEEQHDLDLLDYYFPET